MNPNAQIPVPAETGIVLSHISKSFGSDLIFDDFSLEIKPRGVTALMGPSGCGKTTLCSMLLGLVKPDAGKIENPFVRISCAFQDPRLLPWLSAAENVALVLSGMSKEEKQRAAQNMLKNLGLSDAVQKRPAELSGGMQQRVSLARAFVAPHDLLILDEPFRGLDESNRENVIQLIRGLAEDRPVILVTHDEADAQALDATIVHL